MRILIREEWENSNSSFRTFFEQVNLADLRGTPLNGRSFLKEKNQQQRFYPKKARTMVKIQNLLLFHILEGRWRDCGEADKEDIRLEKEELISHSIFMNVWPWSADEWFLKPVQK